MANVCVIRHQGYIKSNVQFPYRHNLRKGKNYRNENIKTNLSSRNTILVDNLLDNETYLGSFNRFHESGAFHGQLKVSGDESKQTNLQFELVNRLL